MVDLRKEVKRLDKRSIFIGFMLCIILILSAVGVFTTALNQLDYHAQNNYVAFDKSSEWQNWRTDTRFFDKLQNGVAGRKLISAASLGALRSLSYTSTSPESDEQAIGGPANVKAISRKIKRTANMDIVATSPNSAAHTLQEKIEAMGGIVMRIDQSPSSNEYAAMQTRVPVEKLSQAMEEVRKVAQQVENEKVQSEDVTMTVVDTEAHLHNLRAEEQQYLVILKGAKSVQDVLECHEKLSRVRDEIERTDSALKALSFEVAMSALEIRIQSEHKEGDITWRPWQNMRRSFHNSLLGLASFLDSVVALIFWLPILLLWFLLFSVALLFLYRILRWTWRKLKAWGWLPASDPAAETDK